MNDHRFHINSLCTLLAALCGIWLFGCVEPPAQEQSANAVDATDEKHTDTSTTDAGIQPQRCEPAATAPRLISPPSTAILNQSCNKLIFEPAPGFASSQVQLCADRQCSEVLAEEITEKTETYLCDTYNAFQKTVFWRVRALEEDGSIGASSHVWQYHRRGAGYASNIHWGSVPDYNGDGFPELVIGQVGDRQQPGKVLWTDEALWNAPELQTLTEPLDVPGNERLTPETRGFGSALASAGDVNGDGFADLAVGAPIPFEFTGYNGVVYVYFGGPDGLRQDRVQTVYFPGRVSTGFGSSVSAGGDIDGDGYGDLVVGAPGTEDISDMGRVFVYRGGPDGLEYSPVATLIPADGENESFGRTVVAGFNLWGGPGPDIAVGAPTSPNRRVVGSQVEVFADADRQDFELLPHRAFEGPGDPEFGHSLAVFYASGDGLVLAVGSPGDLRGTGAIWMYRSLGDIPFTITHGDTLSSRLGHSMAVEVDSQNNRSDELVVGQPGWSPDAPGRVVTVGGRYVVQGVFAINGQSNHLHLGHAVAAGDFTRDGDPDRVVAAMQEDGSWVIHLFSVPTHEWKDSITVIDGLEARDIVLGR